MLLKSPPKGKNGDAQVKEEEDGEEEEDYDAKIVCIMKLLFK